MVPLIDNIRKTRTHVLDLIKELSLEKLNKVPHGFNNNILWNVGHLVAAQQTICYTRAGLNPFLSEETFNKYKPGTRPERFFQIEEEDEAKKLLFTSIDLLEKDYQQDAFKIYSPWTTRTGLNLTNINEAITYLHYHEGVHTGVISSIKKLIQK